MATDEIREWDGTLPDYQWGKDASADMMLTAYTPDLQKHVAVDPAIFQRYRGCPLRINDSLFSMVLHTH